MDADVKSIEKRFEELGSDHAAVVGDAALCELLDPLRGTAPVRVVCGRHGCGETVTWWGLPVQGKPSIFAPILVEGAEGVRLPMVSPSSPNTQAETGYVYGVGPWIVEGARVVYASVGYQPMYLDAEPGPGIRRQPPHPYDCWSVLWLVVEGNPVQADTAGNGLRLTFHCETCNYRSTLTNTTMLKRLVTTLVADEQETRL